MTDNGKKWVICRTSLFEKQGIFLNHRYQVDWNNYLENVYIMSNHVPKKYFELHTDSDIKYQDWLQKDPIVQQVVDKFESRSREGIKKYGTTLEQNNTDDFLLHLQEELMDAVLYIQKLRSKNGEV